MPRKILDASEVAISCDSFQLMNGNRDSGLRRFCGLCRNLDPDTSVLMNTWWEVPGSAEWSAWFSLP